MSKKCARCEKTVYPTEELKCLDKVSTYFSILLLCSAIFIPVQEINLVQYKLRRTAAVYCTSVSSRQKWFESAVTLPFCGIHLGGISVADPGLFQSWEIREKRWVCQPKWGGAHPVKSGKKFPWTIFKPFNRSQMGGRTSFSALLNLRSCQEITIFALNNVTKASIMKTSKYVYIFEDNVLGHIV